VKRLVEIVHLSCREVTPLSHLQVLQRERSDAHPPEAGHRDAHEVHHPTDDVKHALMEDDLENHPVMRLTKNAAFLGDDTLSVDHQTISQTLELRLPWPGECQDVIFLGEPIAWMHDTVRHITIVGQEEESLRRAIESSDGIDALVHLDEIHHCPPVSLVAHRGDVATRLIQQEVSRRLSAEQLTVNVDLTGAGIDLRAELRDDRAIDGNPASLNKLLGAPAGCHTA